jgi:lipid-binding SYLF domain-containing protein
MPRRIAVRALAITAVCIGLLVSFGAVGISPPEGDLLRHATVVFERATDERGSAIPMSVLLRARGIAVFPHAVQDETRYSGQGVLSARGASPNQWTPPAIIELEGSIPLNLDAPTIDFIVIAQTARGLDHLIQARFVSPVIIPIAPGPLGADMPVRVDADIVAYMQFGDYFAGVTLNDWTVGESKAGNALLYGRPYTTEDIVRGAGFFYLPPAARSWREALMTFFRDVS